MKKLVATAAVAAMLGSAAFADVVNPLMKWLLGKTS